MKLLRLKVDKLYGYLSKEIVFFERINMLIGINGSGKTSIMNILRWLTSPCYEKLCTIKYNEIELEFRYKERIYRLVCKQSNQQVQISLLDLSTNKAFANPIKIDLLMPINDEMHLQKEYEINYKIYKNQLRPEKSEEKLFRFLREIETPFVLGVDREGDMDEEFGGTINTKAFNKNFRLDSLRIIKKIAREHFTEYRNQLSVLDDELKNNILQTLLSFDDNDLVDTSEKQQIIDELIKINTDMTSELEKASSLIFYPQFSNYFNSVRAKISKNNFDETTIENLIILRNQLYKIRDTLIIFNNNSVLAKKAKKNIEEYLNVVNSYFIDSYKEIYFDDNCNELRVRYYDFKKNIIKENVDPSFLSSGEKQLLILFTYCKFYERSLMLIDEPELSLHPKWQDSLVDSLEILLADSQQLIIATHSPSIVGEHTDFWIPLLPV